MVVENILEYILIVVSSCILYYAFRFVRFILKLRRFGQAVDQFPMDKKHFLKGHLDEFLRPKDNTLEYLVKLQKKYPKACGVYYANFLRPYVFVHHPETVRAVISAPGKKPLLFGIHGYAKKWLGDGLLLSSGNKWLRQKRLLEPIFHSDSLKYYIKHYFNQATDIIINKLSVHAKSGEEANVRTMSSLLTFDIILRCVFSYYSGVQDQGSKHYYMKSVGVVSRLWWKRLYEPWTYFDFIYWRTSDGKSFLKNCDILNNFANKIITERRALIKDCSNEASKYNDFLNVLLRCRDDNGVGLTDIEIRDEVNNFIAAGFVGVANNTSWALYKLASNKECQNKCQKEIDDLMSTRSDDYLNWNDLQKLPYLTMCIKETLRLYTVPWLEKEMENDIVIDGKNVPAGCAVAVNVYAHHRNPEIWKDPLKFDPERFSSERLEHLDPYAYIPFQLGRRQCVGQAFAMDEMRIILARLLHRFNFVASENHIPIEKMSLTLVSGNGIMLKVSER